MKNQIKNQIELFFKYFNSIQNNTNEKLKDAKIKSLVFNPEFYNALLKNKYINKNNSTFMGYPFTIDYSKNADFWGMFMEK